jgi:hypothetical protein
VKRSAVGVLGRFDGYSEVVYEVEGKEYRGRLLPLALAAGGAEAVLVAPESLAVLAFGSAEEAAEALERGELGKVFSERVESAFGARAGVVVAQALGGYRGAFEASFENHFDNVVAHLFLDSLDALKGCGELVLDVSTGLNVYAAALLEAARAFVVHSKLRRILQGGAGVKAWIAAVPPVLGGGRYSVGLYDFTSKAFFEFPLRSLEFKPEDFVLSPLSGEEKRELGERLRGPVERLKRVLAEARVAFNALKYNAPLALYHEEIVNLKAADPAAGLEALRLIVAEVERRRRVAVEGGKLSVRRLRLNRALVVNAALALALLESLREFHSAGVAGAEATPSGLLEVFGKVYGLLGLGLNARFLARDVAELAGGEGFLGDAKRNFFAHSGLLSTMIEVRPGGSVAYRCGAAPLVRKWLYDPEA